MSFDKLLKSFTDIISGKPVKPNSGFRGVEIRNISLPTRSASCPYIVIIGALPSVLLIIFPYYILIFYIYTFFKLFYSISNSLILCSPVLIRGTSPNVEIQCYEFRCMFQILDRVSIVLLSKCLYFI